MLKKIFMFLTLLLPLTGCSWNSTSYSDVWCENRFNLTSDFNHRYPEQPNYLDFIESSYYETFYDKTCHYYIKFKPGYNDGKTIDVYGTYTTTLQKFNMAFPGISSRTPEFYLYHSPTIDFHIIDDLVITGQSYTRPFKIVYQAMYLYSARG